MEEKSSKTKYLIIASALAGLVILFLVIRGCGSSAGVTYEYEKISIGDVRKTIVVTGTLQVIDPYNVLAGIGGTVERVLADFNDEVNKGQLLAVIDSTEHDHALAKLSSSLETAKLELSSAKSDLDSKKRMYEEELISQKSYELAEINYKKAYHKFQGIKNDYNHQRQLQQSSRVRSPVNGIVLAREVEANQQIGRGAILFQIVPTMKKMKLIINVDESDVGHVKKGQDVMFSVSAFPERTFSGEISQVRMNPVRSGNIVTYHSVVICDNEELLLRPGMTATATVIVDHKENVLRASNLAMLSSPVARERGNTDTLWKPSISGFEKISIKKGLEGDSHTEILDGVEEGTEVLLRVRN